VDRLNLLEKVFNTVYVPQAVFEEVTIGNKPQSRKLEKYLSDKVINSELEISNIGLGKGELEAIALYKKINSDFLLYDKSHLI